MRAQLPEKLEKGRVRIGNLGTDPKHGANGKFYVRGPQFHPLVIIASDGRHVDAKGWEHVSVSCKRRCPTWEEMCFVKDLFWEPEECVVQFHPPASEYVNHHPFCLHLWLYRSAPFPMPPSHFVGPKAKSNDRINT